MCTDRFDLRALEYWQMRASSGLAELWLDVLLLLLLLLFYFFFFNDTATTEIYTLSLHDALPIWLRYFVLSEFYVTLSSSRQLLGTMRAVMQHDLSAGCKRLLGIGRAHVWTPVTATSRMPSSAWKKKKNTTKQNKTKKIRQSPSTPLSYRI